MQALGALGPLTLIEGEIQKQVGKFLALKSSLNWLRGSSQLNIRAEAEQLYAKQLALEADLQTTLANIEQLKSGAWDMGQVLTIGSFAYTMVDQISDVKNLEKRAYDSGESPFYSNISPMMLIGGAVAVGAVWILLKK